jgi:AcrR family transcriptional regulator
VNALPRNKYPEETVKKILDTSLRLFTEKGYEQTTVLDIVDNLGGLTRGAFYHHFKSKEEVLDSIFEKEYAEYNPFKEAKRTKVANGLEQLKLALRLGLGRNIESKQRNDLANVMASLLSNPRFLAQHIKGTQEDSEDMASLMQKAMADGSIKQGNAKLLAELFMLLVNVWALPAIFPASKEDQADKMALIEQIFIGLGYNFIDEELKKLFVEVVFSINNGTRV